MTKSPHARIALTLTLLAACTLLGACYAGPPYGYPQASYWRPAEGPYVGPGPYDGPDMYRGDSHH